MNTSSYHHGDLAQALLQAAAAIVAEEGLEALSLRACARRAGVSHAAPAHHFGDRAGLLTAYASQLYRELDQALAAVDPALSPWPCLLQMGQVYIAFARARPAAFRLMFRHDALRADDPAYQAAADACLQRVAQPVGQLLPPERQASHTVLFWSALHGYASLAIDGHFEGDCLPGLPAGQVETLGQQVLAALQPLFDGEA